MIVSFFYLVPGTEQRLALHLGPFESVSVTQVHVVGHKDGRNYILGVFELMQGWRVYENDLIGRYYVRNGLSIEPDYQGNFDYAEGFTVTP